MTFLCPLIFILFAALSPFSTAGGNPDSQGTQTFIVRIQNDLKPSAFFDVDEWYRSTLSSVSFKTKQEGVGKISDFLHVYRTVFHGYSARLTSEQAMLLQAQRGIIGIFPDQILHVQTTRSPGFLGLNSYHNPTGLLKESDLGSNVVIGVLDSGIWPENPSFSDEGLGPVPTHFKGKCDGGEGFAASLCNKKLVGARYFSGGIAAMMDPSLEIEQQSARDHIGHGTHTASTAAGRARNHNASFFGYAKGEAIGIAPKARLAIYKVCWTSGCAISDILAAIDKAVQDGVDILSLSVGGSADRYTSDPIAIGSFGAVERGIFVSAAAGNGGPKSSSVLNVAPWLTTVGASTIDRTFLADLVLGNGVILTGTSIYTGKSLREKNYPIIYGRDAGDSKCSKSSLDPKLVKGRIVICVRGEINRLLKGSNVKKAGGVGVVIANDKVFGETLTSDAHVVPGLTISKSANDKLFSYIHSTKDPKATIVFRGTKVSSWPAPAVAGFSSRGPNPLSSYVLKPDILAPGVDILAAWPDDIPPTELREDHRRSGFNILSGTSMSCPHVSGIAALIKGAHPEWSPAVIRSALMTTSYNHYPDGKPLVNQESYTKASVWDMGAGHVDPEKANDPGLAYDLDGDDYVDFLCASDYSESEIRFIIRRGVSCNMSTVKQWNLNYPAIIVARSSEIRLSNKVEVVVTRTLTNVGLAASAYAAVIASPRGANVTVNPPKLNFKKKSEKQSFTVRLSILGNSSSNEMGWLTWTDGQHNRIPEAFARKFGGEFSTSATLTVPTGESWKVALVKEDNQLWFREGWQEFVDYFSIGYAYFLMFTYEGNSKFKVHISNTTASEIHYPYNARNSCQEPKKTHCGDPEGAPDNNNHNSVSFLPRKRGLDDDAGTRAVKTSTDLPVEVIRIDSEDESSLHEHPEQMDGNDVVSGGFLSDSEASDEDELNQYEGSKRSTETSAAKQGTPSVAVEHASYQDEELLKALAAAGISRPENPFFTVAVKTYNLHYGYYMTVPLGFAREYMRCKVGDFVKVEASDGRQWLVRYVNPGGAGHGYTLGSGWIVFARDNKLKVGDVCAFELTDAKKHVLKVHIAKKS